MRRTSLDVRMTNGMVLCGTVPSFETEVCQSDRISRSIDSNSSSTLSTSSMSGTHCRGSYWSDRIKGSLHKKVQRVQASSDGLPSGPELVGLGLEEKLLQGRSNRPSAFSSSMPG